MSTWRLFNLSPTTMPVLLFVFPKASCILAFFFFILSCIIFSIVSVYFRYLLISWSCWWASWNNSFLECAMSTMLLNLVMKTLSMHLCLLRYYSSWSVMEVSPFLKNLPILFRFSSVRWYTISSFLISTTLSLYASYSITAMASIKESLLVSLFYN